MASRPIFSPSPDDDKLVTTRILEFKWHPGMAISQSRRSIAELHAVASRDMGVSRVLEISSKSPLEIGVRLSAFNLMITTVQKRQQFSLECAFQASKVFEHGGPYLDLLSAKSIDAKRDPRLQSSGRLTGFRFFGVDWELLPRTAFYNWLYINALHKQTELALQVLSYDAFSDIAFNPQRSVNCQAYAAALYVALHRRDLLTPDILTTKESYLATIAQFSTGSTQVDGTQGDAFDGRDR